MTSTYEDRTALAVDVAIKAPCRAATTAAITLSGLQTVDGIALVANDRVLVKNQANGAANGIYLASTGAWTRTTDFDGNRDAVDGTIVLVRLGTTSALSLYKLSCSTTPPIIGTTSLVFDLVSIVVGNAGVFTTVSASAGFTGNLTGNVVGNVTGNVTGNLTGNVANATITGSTLTNPANTTQALVDGATINWNVNSGAIATVTLGGSRTMAAPTNLKVGGHYILRVTQDGTGGRTLTWNGVFQDLSGGTMSQPSPGAGSSTQFVFDSDGTNLYANTVETNGTWTKIGNRVFIEGAVTINAIGTGSTTVISGLPFTSASFTTPPCVVTNTAALATAVVSLTGSIATNITFRSRTAANAADAVNAIFQNASAIVFSGNYPAT